MPHTKFPHGLEILAPVEGPHAEILTPGALHFFCELQRAFNARRLELLADRKLRQKSLDAGELPNFPAETKSIREGDWRVDPVPGDLQNRRVEITGPVDRKMVINALNSGANCFMADFEDSNSPTWAGTIDGQINMRDAIRGTIEFQNPEGKTYKLNPQTATLLVRPRGWHLTEKHVRVDGHPASGSLFDFALFAFHNAKYRVAHNSGIYLYLPKMESYLEARLWNDVFILAQKSPRRAARQRQGHRAHRNHPGFISDGGNPARTARAQRRA